jgi:hypothetical protein
MPDHSELKGLALQIAAQLPNDREIAGRVIRHVADLVNWRSEADLPALRPVAAVIPLIEPDPAA